MYLRGAAAQHALLLAQHSDCRPLPVQLPPSGRGPGLSLPGAAEPQEFSSPPPLKHKKSFVMGSIKTKPDLSLFSFLTLIGAHSKLNL